MKKESNTVLAVRNLVKPFAKDLQLDIWDIKYVKEGKDRFLRIFIDKPEGITIEDCENLSRAIDAPLDELDVLSESYCLEVSSPGLERKLEKDEHFLRFIGKAVNVKLLAKKDYKNKCFSGTLKSYNNGTVTVSCDEEDIEFNKKEASFVKLDDFRGDF